MERTLALETTKKVGKKVKVAGWVYARRDHGKLVFIDLKDKSGLVQVVGEEKLGDLRIAAAIEVEGKVRKRPKELNNPKIKTGKIEIKTEKIKLLSRSAELPFDIGPSKLRLRLPTLLDHRPLSLRHPTQEVIFKVQAALVQAFREAMVAQGFTEIFVPTITATATEGGAELFHVDYYDYDAYIAQSPQLYKQIMVGVFERVFTIAHAYRAEPSITTRHLSEYIGLDAEMGFINSWQEIIDTADEVIKYMIDKVFARCKEDLKFRDELKKITDKDWQTLKPKLAKKTPQLKLREAQKILGVSQKEPDLNPQQEKDICEWTSKEKGSEMVIITHYPTKKRPFYTHPDPKDPKYTLSFDFIGRGNVKDVVNEGFEWVTGSQRINDYQQLKDNIKKWGYDPKKFDIYLQAFKYGMPPEGGFCLGLERITQSLLGLANIRQASLFPRDMERVDVRLSTIQARKRKKEK